MTPSDIALDEARKDARAIVDRLTPRQREVLILRCKGFIDREVGVHLGISTSTVNNTVSMMLREMGCATCVEAAVIAAKANLV